MTDSSPEDSAPETIDELKTRLGTGQLVSTEELGSLVYEDLRRIAHGLFQRERPGVTLQATALVHEAYANLAAQDNQTWEGRAHFLAVASTQMRRLLVDAARARSRDKRGGGWERVTLSEHTGDAPDIDLLELEEALTKLSYYGERSVKIVELRFFAGLSIDETAVALGVSRTIIVREWAKAKAVLMTLLEDERGTEAT